MQKVLVDPTKVKLILENMNYGVATLKTDEAEAWLKRNNYTFCTIRNSTSNLQSINLHDGTKVYLSPLNEKITKEVLEILEEDIKSVRLNDIERTKILNKIAIAINSNRDLFAQLNMICNGHLQKDTKMLDIPIMVDYFQYYSNWASLVNIDFKDMQPYEGFVAVILSKTTPLFTFAIALAASFAAGNRTIICVEGALVPLAFLLLELCSNAGMPKEYLRVVPYENSYDLNNITKLETHLAKVTYFGDKEGTQHLKSDSVGFMKHFDTFINCRSSMIVLNDADIHSACETIVNSAWIHLNQLPWALSTVYVQEAAFESFVRNLKQRLDKIVFGSFNDKSTDIYLNNEKISSETFKSYIEKMKIAGAEIFQPSTVNRPDNKIVVAPTIVIGSKYFENTTDGPILQILSFRTISELIPLINSHAYSEFAVSIWTENGSLAQEVSQALHTTTIWTNCFGYINAQVALNFYQQRGYFGGKEGLLTYLHHSKHQRQCPLLFTETDAPEDKVVISKVEAAKKTYGGWSKKSRAIRANLLRKLAQEIEINQKELQNVKLDNGLNNCDEWIEKLYENAARSQISSTQSFVENYELTAVKEPCGLVVIYSVGSLLAIQLITAAIAYGNVVILVMKNTDFIKELCKLMTKVGFPENVLIPIQNLGPCTFLLQQKEIQNYWIDTSNSSNISDTWLINRQSMQKLGADKLKNISLFNDSSNFDKDTIEMIFTKTKSIYSTFGETISNI